MASFTAQPSSTSVLSRVLSKVVREHVCISTASHVEAFSNDISPMVACLTDSAQSQSSLVTKMSGYGRDDWGSIPGWCTNYRQAVGSTSSAV